jgi:hypothetical protein
MDTILLANAVVFVIGAVFFARVFSNRRKLAIFLAFLINIPNLIFLSYLISRSDLYAFMFVGFVVASGFGGFGIGAIVGMIYVFIRTNGVRGP